MDTVSTNRLAVHHTMASLIETIRVALNGDGSWIEPGSVDSQGLTVYAGVYRFRVELSEPELADWTDHTPAESEDRDVMEEDDHSHDAYIGGHDFDDEGYIEPAF